MKIFKEWKNRKQCYEKGYSYGEAVLSFMKLRRRSCASPRNYVIEKCHVSGYFHAGENKTTSVMLFCDDRRRLLLSEQALRSAAKNMQPSDRSKRQRSKNAMRLGMTCLQNGRSMIEMLGVLAIIGVLSVGGIMGYSKAMHRYRLNKTIDIMSRVFHNFDVITSSKTVADGEEFYTAEDMIQYGFIDKDDCPIVDGPWGDSVCELPLGQLGWAMKFYLTPQRYNNNPNKFHGEFYLNFTGANRIEACIDFVSHDWLNIIPRKWWMPYGYIQIGNNYIYDYSGNSGLPADTKPTLEQIVEACSTCEGQDECVWFVVFSWEL